MDSYLAEEGEVDVGTDEEGNIVLTIQTGVLILTPDEARRLIRKMRVELGNS